MNLKYGTRNIFQPSLAGLVLELKLCQGNFPLPPPPPPRAILSNFGKNLKNLEVHKWMPELPKNTQISNTAAVFYLSRYWWFFG